MIALILKLFGILAFFYYLLTAFFVFLVLIEESSENPIWVNFIDAIIWPLNVLWALLEKGFDD